MLELDFEPGSHVCHLYQGANEFKEVSLAFIRDGLMNGECCLFVADESAIDDWYLEFQASGIDVLTARHAGALEVSPSDSWRMVGHRSSVVRAREFLKMYNEKLTKFTGIRFAGDCTWGCDDAVPPDRLCHWEATLNVAMEGLEARGICQYDLDLYDAEFVHAALRTHPVVIYQRRTLVNPFYEAGLILECEPALNSSSSDPSVVAAMLAKLAALP